MAAPVQVKGLRELQVKFEKVAGAVASNRYLMGQIGAFVETEILRRTAAGLDIDENPFPAYSKSYSTWRAKQGRPVDKPDLFFTGSMLSALTTQETPHQVSLFFMDTPDKFGMRNPEKAFYNQQLRNFFALSAKDVDAVQNMVSEHIKKVLKKG